VDITHEAREGYLYIQVSGEFDQHDVEQAFLGWVKFARIHGYDRAICDITQVTGFDSYSTPLMKRFEAAEFIGVTLPRDMRLVVLETGKQLSEGQFSGELMSRMGAQVKVTAEVGSALEWLEVPAT
jgi:hypothetical protein